MNEIGTSPPNPNMPRKSYAGGTFTGLVVIIVGLGFLAGNFGIHLPLFAWHNWWALFILVGAAGPASHALRRYRDTGAVDVWR